MTCRFHIVIRIQEYDQSDKAGSSASKLLSQSFLRRMDHGEGHLAETCCHQRKDGYFPSAHLPPQQVDESDGQLCKTTTGFRSLIDKAPPSP